MTKQKEVTKEFYKKWNMYYYRTTYRVYSVYKKDSEKRMLDFNLSDIQFKILVKSPCYLCGYQSPKGIGIDRVDNSIRAYTINNCRPCCGSCNDMKGEFTLEEFLNKCTSIVKVCSIKTLPQIPMPEDPLKQVFDKGGLMPAEERKHWKALGLYYAILSNTADKFLEDYSAVYTIQEYTDLCNTIRSLAKESAIKSLQTLLRTLKKRKQRA
jgi:hypothetical protein